MKSGSVLFFFVIVFFLTGCSNKSTVNSDATQLPKPTIVIVHGAWGGSWAFKEVDEILTKKGYNVYRPSLTGLGERVHLGSVEVNLSTHIHDVVNTFLFEELTDVILIGHSYGGMVITGVQDSIPDKIKHLIYLDAFVPNNGESVLTMGDPSWILDKTQGDFVVAPWVKEGQRPPKDVPHPKNCFSETLQLKNEVMSEGSFILTVDEGREPVEDSFHSAYLRAQDRGWELYELTADHNPQWSAVQEFCELLIQIFEKESN